MVTRNIVKEFAESGDAGWKLDSPEVTQFVFSQLGEFEDIYLVCTSAEDFYLINGEYIRVYERKNGKAQSE